MIIRRLHTALLLFTALAATAVAQDNPVYVDESPTAIELLKQADALTGTNLGEAANVLQSLLEDSGGQVIPLSSSGTRFTGIRSLVLQRLRANPELLESWLERFSSAADATYERGELNATEARWPLTEAGLQATLELGQRDLELAAFNRGTTRMRQALAHPAADDRSNSAAWYGLALGAAATGDDDTLDEATAALDLIGPSGRSALDRIERWSFRGPAPGVDTPHHIGTNTNMDSLVGLSIWSTTLDDSLLLQRYGSPLRMTRPTREDSGDDATTGWFTTATPARFEDLIFINLGQHIIAFDALTGLERWRHDHRSQDIMLDPNQRPIGANDIDAQGRTIVTITGIDYGNERSGDGAILCLDGPTGRLRWSVVLDDHPDIEGSDGMFPCSAPVVYEGIVYVLARVITPQRLHSESLVAIDLSSGRVLWTRWIASSGRTRNHTMRPVVPPEPVGDLMLTRSGAGAIAGVDAESGALRWLHRMDTAKDGTKNLRARPYTTPRTVGTPQGMLVPAPDDSALLLVDPDSGTILDRILSTQNDAFNTPLYLLGDDTRLYVVGSDLRCFANDELDTPLWIRPWSDVDRELMPAGRIQLLQDSLLVPFADRIVQIDADDGTILRSLPVDKAGNVLLADDRLIVASATHLETYTAFDLAEEALLNRIAADPTDAELRMDLVRLAARGQNDTLLIEAGTNALELIESTNHSGEIRDRLIAHFIEVLQRTDSKLDDSERIEQLMRRTARTSPQRLEIELAIGDFWRSDMPARSAGHWLSILDDPSMATAWHSENDIHARGAAWARRRLSTLGDEHEAPALWIDSNDDQSLSRQLAAARTNLRWTMDTDRLGAMLPDLLRRLHEAGRGDAAEALLQGWRLRHGTAEAIDLDGSWTPPVDQNDAGDGNQSIPRRITGRHLSPSPSSIADMDHDLTLLLSTNTLQGIESSTFETRWTQPTDAIFGNLLQADDERLTILLADGNGDISLQEIDPKTGSTLGRLTDIAAMFETPPINTSRLQPIMPDGRMIGLEDILVVANDSMVAFVRRDGAAMVINGAIQDESVHQLRLPLRVVHDLEAWPDGFVVIGPAPESSQSIAVSNADPAIVHVEATTGDVLEIEWPDTLGRVLWIERSPLDDLILGGEQGIAMVPRPEQKATWMNTDTRLQYTRKGWATGESLLMLDAEDQLATLNLVDGSINGPLGTPRHRTLGTLKMIQPEPDGFQILREGALVLHDTQGTLTGTDSLPGTMQHEHLVRNGTEYLLVSYLQSISRGQAGARGGGRQHLYRVHRLDASGRLIDLFDLYPLQSRIRAVRSLGTGLVLETDSAVELIPLPDDSVQ